MVGMTLNTMPDIQHRDAEGNLIDNPKLALIGKSFQIFYDQRKISVFPAEAVCISWFTIEYLLR